MMPDLTDLSDLDAWRDRSSRNLAAFWEYIPRAMGLPCERWEDAWAADTGLPVATPNSATLLRPLPESAAPELVARLDAFYSSHPGGPWLLWSAWPTPDLSVSGMRLSGHPPLMVRLPGPLPPALPELRIVEAHDDATLLAFDRVMIHGFPVDELRAGDQLTGRLSDPRALGGPLRFFIGYLGDEPVTCAASLIGEQEVGVYMVATMPQARGKGYGGAVTVAAIASAPHLPAVLQASDDGQPVYARLGFQTVAPFTLWYKPRA
jgi:ribosomal protein S18 acetylase RimI-like enzyme